MSIKQTAQKITEEAMLFVKDKYGANSSFYLEIGTRKITLYAKGKSVYFTRLLEDNRMYKMSYKDYFFNEALEEFQSLMPFVKKYMEAYASYKGNGDFIIVSAKDETLKKDVKELVQLIDETPFNKAERSLIHHYFKEVEIGGFYGGRLKEQEVQSIKNALSTYTYIKELMEKQPLMHLISDDIKDVIGKELKLKYYGETLLIENDKTENRLNILLENLIETFTVNFPIVEEDILSVLRVVEEKNRIKNLMNPSNEYFTAFIENHVGLYDLQEENRDRQFENLVEYFGEWTEVEKIFKKLLDMESEYNKHMREMLDLEFKIGSQAAMQCYTIQINEYRFYFAAHGELGEWKQTIFKVSVTKDNIVPAEFGQYVSQVVGGQIQAKLTDFKY